MNQMEMFEQLAEDRSISTEDLDKMAEAVARAKADYESKKAISNDAYHFYQECQGKMITMLRSVNKSKYFVDKLGTFSVSEKLKVRTPQDFESKEKFFTWLNQTHGKEGFLAFVGINYMTLQKLYNQEFEQAKENGDAAEFNIPGIGDPEAEWSLSIRAAKK